MKLDEVREGNHRLSPKLMKAATMRNMRVENPAVKLGGLVSGVRYNIADQCERYIFILISTTLIEDCGRRWGLHTPLEKATLEGFA